MEYYTFGSFVSKKISLRTKVWGRRELALLDGSNIGVLGAYSYKGLVGESVVLQSSGHISLIAAQNYTITGSVVAVAEVVDKSVSIDFEARYLLESDPNNPTFLSLKGLKSTTELVQNPEFQALVWRMCKVHPMMVEPTLDTRTTFEVSATRFKYKKEPLNDLPDVPAQWVTDVTVDRNEGGFVTLCSDDSRLRTLFTDFYMYEFDEAHDPPDLEESPAMRVARGFKKEFHLAIRYLEHADEIKGIVHMLRAWETYFIRLFLQFVATQKLQHCGIFVERLRSCQRRIKG